MARWEWIGIIKAEDTGLSQDLQMRYRATTVNVLRMAVIQTRRRRRTRTLSA